jgi:hypothetical protein
VVARHSVARFPPRSWAAVLSSSLRDRQVWPNPRRFSLLVVTMTPAAATSFFRPEFNDFLYAPIGSERNGMTLSLLSALARLNVDPWAEAAGLSQLPKPAAAQKLAVLIARLPPGAWAQGDCYAIASRLIELLPRASGSDASSPRGPRRINLSAAPILIAVALGLAALLMAAIREPSSRGDAPDTPAYTGSAKWR